MTPERWRRVEDLFHSVGELPPSERGTFLAQACADDVDLRREVESLLAGREGTLLAGGVGAAAARVMPARGRWEGRALGTYQLGEMIGAGGMGEVYRARDSRLGRDVAVKILSGDFAGSAERMARFEREARILATLNHPNIAAIYGLEESAGIRALVLELVEGVTLAEKLQTDAGVRCALSLRDALPIATQITRACEAAHQKGIVHRDLKPANIKIAPDGTVKVLDFGVAKFDAPREPGPTGSGVLSTVEGAVLGTVAYMSPEQARGLPVDRRTDIWAFGCVLYEMLTGCRSFPGDSSADVMGAITSRDPDWTLLPPDTPARVRDVLRRCLAKDAERRYHDVADVRVELEEALDPSASVAAVTSVSSAPGWRTRLPWIGAAAIAAAAIIGVWVQRPQETTERRGPARVSIELPPAVAVYAIGRGSSVAISPDAQRVVYVAVAGDSTRLLSRPLDGLESSPVAGTEGATNPFFSPDGRWIGFWSNRSLKKVPASGGVATTVVENANFLGAWWGGDDTILYSAPDGEVWRVPSGGGTPQRITTRAEAGAVHSWSQMLPGGRSVLYTVWNNTGFEGGRIVVQPLAGGSPTVLVERGSHGRVVARDGIAFLVYARPEGLMAAPFDLESARVVGAPELVQPGVLTNLSGGAHFSVSAEGVLAYVPGELYESDKTMLWVNTDGKTIELPPMPGVGFQYRLSPDGSKLVRPNAAGANRDLWIDDLTGRTASIRLTFDQVTNLPIWTHDGSRVIYTRGEQVDNLFWRAADGSGVEERLTTSPNPQITGSVTPDGTLVYFERDPKSGFDLWLLPLNGPRQPRRFLSTPRNEGNPRTSPDGRWVAYQSNISGNVEVYVASFPGAATRLQASQGGGQGPMWSPDGRELYYRAPQSQGSGQMMAVTVDTTGAEPHIGSPRVLFPGPFQGNGDVAPDGRFLLVKQTTRESATRVIQLVFDWFDELKTKVPHR
ncbi:MAG: protein kinase [Acidobacteriota bacterium]|nr:protein kinase [Acidobacteriota bacterium]